MVNGLGQSQAEQPSGRYVTVGRGDAAYRAFVPAPLPPALTYDAEVVRALSDADRAIGELAGLARQEFGIPIGDWFAARETVYSARIESLDIDLLDLFAFNERLFPLPDLRPRPPVHVLAEVVNGKLALDHGWHRLDSLPVSLRLMREVHAQLFAGIREEQTTPGEFRRSQNWLGAAGALLGEATYVPPPPAELAAALDAFEKYLHLDDGNPPLVRLALIHQHFEAIHPFLDGNGRIGRMLIPLLLCVWGVLPGPWLTLSAYFLRHQREYYRHLLAVNEQGGWRDWLLFFLRGVAEEARGSFTRAQQLVALHDRWINWSNTPRRNAARTRCVESFFHRPILPYGRYIDQLAAAGFVQVLNDPQRGPIVVAREIFRVMDE